MRSITKSTADIGKSDSKPHEDPESNINFEETTEMADLMAEMEAEVLIGNH